LLRLIGEEDSADIEPVIVTKSYRRNNIGTLLVKHALAEAGKISIPLLSVRPMARNNDAIAFFGKLGFALRGRVDSLHYVSESRDKKWDTVTLVRRNLLKY
jgi:GNAT superfamily N-acetyltransferase